MAEFGPLGRANATIVTSGWCAQVFGPEFPVLGTRTCARIVVQRRVRDIHAYGVEFLEPGKARNFWGIRFPSHLEERRAS